MLTIKDLEGVKLVSDEKYYATLQETQEVLEVCFQQASQGWGVRRHDGVILRLAADLKIALTLANAADDAQRMLKGSQMALGREKKIRENLQAGNEILQTQLKVLDDSLSKFKSENGDLNIRVLQLEAELKSLTAE